MGLYSPRYGHILHVASFGQVLFGQGFSILAENAHLTKGPRARQAKKTRLKTLMWAMLESGLTGAAARRQVVT